MKNNKCTAKCKEQKGGVISVMFQEINENDVKRIEHFSKSEEPFIDENGKRWYKVK